MAGAPLGWMAVCPQAMSYSCTGLANAQGTQGMWTGLCWVSPRPSTRTISEASHHHSRPVLTVSLLFPGLYHPALSPHPTSCPASLMGHAAAAHAGGAGPLWKAGGSPTGISKEEEGRAGCLPPREGWREGVQPHSTALGLSPGAGGLQNQGQWGGRVRGAATCSGRARLSRYWQ